MLCAQLEAFLGQCSMDWHFDAFHLNELSEGHPLSALAFWLLHTTGMHTLRAAGAALLDMCWAAHTCAGLFDHFHLDRGKAARFLLAVEAGYQSNPWVCRAAWRHTKQGQGQQRL